MKNNDEKLPGGKMNLQMRWQAEFVMRIDSILEEVRKEFPNLSRHDLIFKWVSEQLVKEEKKLDNTK